MSLNEFILLFYFWSEFISNSFPSEESGDLDPNVLPDPEACPKDGPIDLGSKELAELIKADEEVAACLTSIKVVQNNKSALLTLNNFLTFWFLKYNSKIISSLVCLSIN